MARVDDAFKIVVGVDGSEASVEALRQAQRFAKPLAAEIEAVACWEYPNMYDSYVAVGIGGFKERAEELLQEAVTMAFGAERPRNVHTRLVEGFARSVLVDASNEADLLVVGRRGRGGFAGLLLGSVSSACVAHAHCPVLVVRAAAKEGSARWAVPFPLVL
ncbi:universal stress protein UspA [Arthrobacter sp. Soil736]|uniref:universal stress protein n=1 Tax=Arthrobacter sp. Soil736 TaxID=1736395 RepID=UPI0006FF38BB|nr:universal stress protein [Arthrobacter sp. Soil736]KRE64976.1 universal stress protein UspA [Arthrobacter sp. Soil736]